jgi:DNA polymerase family B
MKKALVDYQLDRPKVLRSYTDNMLEYLKMKYPDIPEDKILSFLQKYVKKNVIRKQIQIIVHPDYGDSVLSNVDLLEYTQNIGNRIITPFGCVYMLPTEKESILKLAIDDNIAERAVLKKTMLEAASRGDTITEQIMHFQQASTKIFNNSISGAQGSTFSPLCDLPGYNSITAVGRHAVTAAYAHIERLICGNNYFNTFNSVINYFVQIHKCIPSNLMNIVEKYRIYVPTVKDVYDYVISSTQFYMLEKDIKDRLIELIKYAPILTRIYIFYAGCFINFIKYNDQLARTMFSLFFRTDLDIDPTVNPISFFKIEEDIRILNLSINSDIIYNTRIDEMCNKYPDEVRKLISISNNMEHVLINYDDLISALFYPDFDTPDPMSHPNMIRKTVVLSDTDSVVYTNQSIVEWYTGYISFNKEAYQINAFMIYLISITLKHVLARISTGIGIVPNDRKRIAMKNEFTFPIFFRTSVKKNYIDLVTSQEGRILPKPKMDIKGGQLRSSTRAKESNEQVDILAKWLFDEVINEEKIEAKECIARVISHEKRIFESLMSGDRTYLMNKTIKFEKEYKNPMQSNYFYYVLWNEVFAPLFGPFVLPNKGFSIDVLNDGKAIRTETYLDEVKKTDVALYDRLIKFLDKYPDKKINCIIYPPTIVVTPQILRPLIDHRDIIHNNCASLYLIMHSLGLSVSDSKQKVLYSDFYDSFGDQLIL